MRAIAEFVMRGRKEAIGVAVIAAALPFLQWLSTAVVCLVVLRRGLPEGSVVLLWASLPMLGMAALVGDVTPVILLLGTVATALILRSTTSWELTLLGSVVFAIVGALVFQITSADVIDEVVVAYREFMLGVQSQAQSESQAAALSVPELDVVKPLLLGYFTMGYALSMVIFLILARWWQSVLYNPGGFQQEFHQIRLSPLVAAGLVLAFLGCVSVEFLNRWMQVFTVPLMIAGLGFVHWIIKEKALSGSWLVGFYVFAVLLQLFPALAFIALMDSWFDLRKKIQKNEV